MWSGDNVPTAANTFGNPSYSAVIHTTYVISPTLLNEVAFNYNGNRIAILPTGVIARPSGFTSNRIFTGPNNDNRIPEIHLNGYNGPTTPPQVGLGKTKRTTIRSAMTFPGPRVPTSSRWAAAGRFTRRSRTCSDNTQGSFTFNNNFTGNDFADFLLGQRFVLQRTRGSGSWILEQRLLGRLCAGQLARQPSPDPEPWSALGRRSAHLRSQQSYGQLLPQPLQSGRCSSFRSGFERQLDLRRYHPGCSGASPGLGTSPNPILAGYQFYLNGIGIPGTTPGVPKGLVNNHWAAFGPRVGFAYDLTGSGKTILRGGFGVMYERIQGNDMYNAGPNVPFSTNVNFNNVEIGNPSTDFGTGNPLVAPITVAGITGLDQIQNKLPVSYQYSFGVQHALSARSVLSVSYVGNQNRHQNDYRETNLPDPSTFGALFLANGTGYNTFVPYRGFNSIKMSEDVQNSHYNGLQAELHSQIRHDLTLQAAYTLSRAIDPATSGNGVSDLNNTSNPYSHAYDNGPSGLDRTQIAFVNFIYDIPFLKDSSNKLLKSTVGGWQVSGIVSLTSGEPLNINEGGITNCAQVTNPSTCVGSLAGTGNISSIIPNANNRPNVSGSVSYPKTVANWFNGSPFAPTVAGTWGNEPFNDLRGPARQNWNLALFKSFLFSEARGSRMEFRAEFFNAFNHTEFNSISTTFSSGNFGAITSAHDPREIQLGLKLYF